MNLELMGNIYFCIAFAEKKGELNFEQAQASLRSLHFPPFTDIDEMEMTKDWHELAERKMNELIDNSGSLIVKLHKDALDHIEMKLMLQYHEDLRKWCQK